MYNHLHNLKRMLPWCALMLLAASAVVSRAQTVTLANPHWNITLTDAGYSDFLLDNTPGFEGREYLSGEWGAAVGYQRGGGEIVSPQWLEPQFLFPDWATRTTFHVVTPVVQTGVNADNLPIAESVVANNDLQVTLRHEMIDTVVGTPMGITAASTNSGLEFIASSRYVLKQTATLKNISGSAISGIQFFQLLHGLWSERGVFDDHLYSGALSQFQHDITLAGVDPLAVGAGSSSSGLEDFISFQATNVPSAFEVGYYGLEGNGVDDHANGKPSDGVHLSVEDNWRTQPYSLREGTDWFLPARRWVSGAQRWELGSLAANESVSIDILLSVRTGTRVAGGTDKSGGCNGGSSVPGGADYEFEDVTSPGSCFGEYSQPDESEVALLVDEGKFTAFNFLTPGEPSQVWKLQFTGSFSGDVHLTFGYDPTMLPPGFDESSLCLYEFSGSGWQKLAGSVNASSNTISVASSYLSSFVLGVDSASLVSVTADCVPANSGTITGTGQYASGSSISLVAAPLAGYAFTNWTESGFVVSASPSLTFLANQPRTLLANFVPVGDGKVITTVSAPASGGGTSGDGAYALGSTATVVATPNPGYKFSKWLENGVVVSTSRTNSFFVTGDRSLVAKFKPVYVVTATPEPVTGGELEVDAMYEMGELAKLKAVPLAGYSFVNWTQNGIQVSTSPNFQFNVTGNRDLVGHFALGWRMDVAAEPANGGTVTGAGVYPQASAVELQAWAKPGYVFLNWTEGGTVVSSSALFTFTSVTNRALAANFVAQPALLQRVLAQGSCAVSWPAGATGWILEESGGVDLANWVTSDRLINTVGERNEITVPPGSSNVFFRLRHK